MIEFQDVGVVYAGSDSPALTGVSLSVAPGQWVALLGANGSGKSTLARLANALILPTTGAVHVDGMDTRDESVVWDVRSRVGLVQQSPENQIVGTIAEEDVAFGPENLGIPTAELRTRVDAALSAVGLDGFQRREPHLLSEGQKQRLAIAGALAMRPAYLVLDEPTAMLDGTGRADVLAIVRSLRASGVGILHITHHLADIASADRAAVLDSGAIVFEGTPADLFADPGRVRRLGIGLPPMTTLVSVLRERGHAVPATTVEAESLVESLWPS